MSRCEICKKEFKTRKKGKLGKQRFCSIVCQSIWQTKTELGPNNPNYKGGATRWKSCELCSIPFFCERYIDYIRRKFCSRRCKDKGQDIRGENNPNWKGGITEENRVERSSKRHKQWSQQILQRDDYVCQACGKRGGDLHAHHLLGFKLHRQYRYILENGITLCLQCHYPTYKFNGNQYKAASIEKGVNSENIPNWGQLRAKLLDEIRQKKSVTVKIERKAIISIKAPLERDDMT